MNQKPPIKTRPDNLKSKNESIRKTESDMNPESQGKAALRKARGKHDRKHEPEHGNQFEGGFL